MEMKMLNTWNNNYEHFIFFFNLDLPKAQLYEVKSYYKITISFFQLRGVIYSL